MGGTGSMWYFTGTFSTGSILGFIALDPSHGEKIDAVHAGGCTHGASGEQRPHLVARVGARPVDGARGAGRLARRTARARLIDGRPELPTGRREAQGMGQGVRPPA